MFFMFDESPVFKSRGLVQMFAITQEWKLTDNTSNLKDNTWYKQKYYNSKAQIRQNIKRAIKSTS